MDNARATKAETTDTEIAHRINNALIVKGVNVRSLSDETGISYQTLRRSLRGGRSLTFLEFGKIAAAINVDPSTLIPESLSVKSAA